MAVFKQIGGGNHTVNPFEVNYSQSFAWTSGSTSQSGSGFSINLVDEPPTNYPFSTTQSLGGVTDGGFNSYPMFNSIKKYFYIGETGSSAENIYGFYPSGSMFVWNIGSKYTGNGIKPNTFKIELDDNIINLTGASYNNDPTITHATNANVKVGMWVVGTGIPVGATVASVTSNTVFELSVATTGGSKTGQTLTLEGLGVGHYSNRIDSGSALPFISTIGLYNDFNELLVVGKLSKPITRMKYSDQTFVIKFDE